MIAAVTMFLAGLLTGAGLACFAAGLLATAPLAPIAPPRDQTPVAWVTPGPTPTMRPFAAHGTPAAATVRDHCTHAALRGPRCPVTAPPHYGSLMQLATESAR